MTEEEEDADGLTPAILEARYEKTLLFAIVTERLYRVSSLSLLSGVQL